MLVDVEAAAAGRRAARARGARHERLVRLEARERAAFDDGADVIVKHRYVQPPLIPNAIEPRGVVARLEPGGDVTLWSATQVPHILRLLTAATLGMLRDEAARDRPGRRRRLRLQARRLRRGAARRRARPPARNAGEVDRGALGERAGDDPRPRLRDDARARGDEGRARSPSLRANVHASMGAYLQLVTPGHPAARGLDLRRSVRDPELQRHVHGRLHEHDARPTPTAAPAGPRRPTCSSGRWTCSPRSSGSTGSSCAAGTSSPSSRPRSPRG